MTQEDKELLLQDLCARLPYGVKFKADNEECIREIHYIKDEDVYIREYRNLSYWVDTIKPYLRPMSSMTKEEKKEYERFSHLSIGFAPILMDWIYLHHLDCCGLIEKDLAIKVTEGMYNV